MIYLKRLSTLFIFTEMTNTMRCIARTVYLQFTRTSPIARDASGEIALFAFVC